METLSRVEPATVSPGLGGGRSMSRVVTFHRGPSVVVWTVYSVQLAPSLSRLHHPLSLFDYLGGIRVSVTGLYLHPKKELGVPVCYLRQRTNGKPG